MNAPDLVKYWKRLTNGYILIGRDAKLMKNAREIFTAPQILCGMHLYQEKFITIPQFLREEKDWLIEDEQWAEIELARWISGQTPSAYYVFKDLQNETTNWGVAHARQALQELKEWADRIIS